MNALTLSATRRRDQVVILTGLAIGASSSTLPGIRLARILRRTWKNFRRTCSLRRAVRALFSARLSMAVGALGIAAMWWHGAAIADTLRAQTAVALDCLCASPWILAAIYHLGTADSGKGGVE